VCEAYALGCVCRVAAGDTLLQRNGYQRKVTFHSINLCQDHSEILLRSFRDKVFWEIFDFPYSNSSCESEKYVRTYEVFFVGVNVHLPSLVLHFFPCSGAKLAFYSDTQELFIITEERVWVLFKMCFFALFKHKYHFSC